MSKLATLVVAVGALALAFVTLSPNSAEAGWRRWGWGPGPGVNVYVGPRHGWYGYRPYYRPYAYHHGYHTAITPIGADATGAAGIRHAAILRARGSLLTLGLMRAAVFPPKAAALPFYSPRSSASPPRNTASAFAV